MQNKTSRDVSMLRHVKIAKLLTKSGVKVALSRCQIAFSCIDTICTIQILEYACLPSLLIPSIAENLSPLNLHEMEFSLQF